METKDEDNKMDILYKSVFKRLHEAAEAMVASGVIKKSRKSKKKKQRKRDKKNGI